MAVDTDIEQIDKQGQPEHVLTEYAVHTVSIVGEGALGRNLTLAKNADKKANLLATPEGKKLAEKIEKAKALDAAEAEAKATADAAAQAESDEKQTEEAPAEDAQVDSQEETPKDDTSAPVEADESVEGDTEAPAEDGKVEKTKSEEEASEDAAPAAEEGEGETASDSEGAAAEEAAAEDAPAEDEPASDPEKVEKTKSIAPEELGDVMKTAMDGMVDLWKRIAQAAPEAEMWEIWDVLNGALWDTDDAMWWQRQDLISEAYDEALKIVQGKVEKTKALKVMETGTFDEQIKALEKINPAMAEMVKAERTKSLKLEEEAKAAAKAKALAEGEQMFKRIATDDNTVENIVDAMTAIESLAPAEHKVLTKALETASNITMAGDLFTDKGSSESAQIQTEAEYVESKAKSLVEAEGGNLAAARATIRQTAEYQALYS